MSMLDRVTKGKKEMPILMLLHSPDGVGKTTFGSEAPDPIFLEREEGSNNLDVARFPRPDSWGDVLKCIDSLTRESHQYKSLVIDSLDWLEQLIVEHICKKYGTDSIEKAAGGFGKGYREVLDEWIKFQSKLSTLRESKKMHIICLAHSQVTEFNDPTTESAYNRFELKLFKSTNGNTDMRSLWREYVDILAFANFETYSKGEGKEARGLSTKTRKMFLERDARWDAKNRFSLPAQIDMELGSSFSKLYNLVYENKDKPVDCAPLYEECKELLSKVSDAETQERARAMVEENKENYKNLQAYKKRLEIIVSGQG